MISAVNLQPFIGGESQIETMQTFVLIIMSYPSYRRHACPYLFMKAASSGVDLSCTFSLPLARFGGHVAATCPGACHSV